MEKVSPKIVILTGAGLSAESGLGTFRDQNGLWSRYRIEDVATPDGFSRNPQLVHDFYNARRLQAGAAQPNAAHAALARLQDGWEGEVVIVTQNVDGLHEAAGSKDVLHMHGRLSKALCAQCDHRWDAPDHMAPSDSCPACQQRATRPDVVWFGEIPYGMDQIYDHLVECDVFAAIGTSGQVYPAAAFVQEAHAVGAETIELNLEPSATASDFGRVLLGPATQTVPSWVDALLSGR